MQNSYSAGHIPLQVRLDLHAWFPEISWKKNNTDVEQAFKVIAAYLLERTFRFTTS